MSLKPVAYIQGPDGEEIELVVTSPDPWDGTLVMQEPEPKYLPKDFWIRFVPYEDVT